jgi:hypothetical protein
LCRYLAHGTATDHMYVLLKVPLAFTWEIYGDTTAEYDDCFRMFNPLDRITFERVLDDWAGAIFRLMELLPSHPSTPALDLTRWVGICLCCYDSVKKSGMLRSSFRTIVALQRLSCARGMESRGDERCFCLHSWSKCPLCIGDHWSASNSHVVVPVLFRYVQT